MTLITAIIIITSIKVRNRTVHGVLRTKAPVEGTPNIGRDARTSLC